MNKTFSPNPAQLRSMVINAPNTYNIWPRGQGKTNDVADKMQLVAHLFPRGSSAFVGRTYKNLKYLILPEVVKGLEQRGYYEGYHFVIGTKPKESLQYPRPYAPPLEYTFCITWYTGHVIYLVSQDRVGSFRGPTIDFVFVDEFLTIKKEHFEREVLAANRANIALFGHIPLHHGIHATSSKPIGTTDQWILSIGDYYKLDGKKYDNIITELTDLEYEFIGIPTEKKEQRIKLWSDIISLSKELQWYPSKEGVFYNETRVWNNIKNLGWKWLKDEYRSMSELIFRVEILNCYLGGVLDSFYPTFKEYIHVDFDTYNYTYIDTLPQKKDSVEFTDCRWDLDWDTNSPILLGQDFGVNINNLLAAQRKGDDQREIRILKEFQVEAPLWTKDVVKLFCNYYKVHKCKYIKYYPDVSGKNRQANSPPLVDDCIEILEQNGWTVEVCNGLDATPHEDKYHILHTVFKEENPEGLYVRINGNNCENLIKSIKLSPVEKFNGGIRKDKSSERSKVISQKIATHGSDTLDLIVCGESQYSSQSISGIGAYIR